MVVYQNPSGMTINSPKTGNFTPLPAKDRQHLAPIFICKQIETCKSKPKRLQCPDMVTILAALSAITYGFADFTGGLATRRSSVSAVVAWSQAVGILVALAAIPLLGGSTITWQSWLWGAAAGLSGAAGLGFLYQGLATGLAAVVSPAAAVAGAVLPVVFGYLVGERPEVLIWAGVVLALPAILLLSIERGDGRGEALKSLRMGLIAGLGFGGFFILLSQTSRDSGLWPLLAARTASVPALLLITMLRRKPLVLSKGSRAAALGAGVMDMGANVFYLLAARSGMLIVAAVVTSLYPAPTVLLQRIVFKEKIGPARFFGLILALAGIALISVGSR
jgi:drug/metabolite transporter (DMT)-like permease